MTTFTVRKTSKKTKKKIVCERKKSFAINESKHLTFSLRHSSINNLFCSQSVSLQFQQTSNVLFASLNHRWTFNSSENCWIVWGYSEIAHEIEVVFAYVIFRLFILNESIQALLSRRNSEILIIVHKSLLINDKWKKRKKNKIYKNFENKKTKYLYN